VWRACFNAESASWAERPAVTAVKLAGTPPVGMAVAMVGSNPGRASYTKI
jgi:hypothetical protein